MEQSTANKNLMLIWDFLCSGFSNSVLFGASQIEKLEYWRKQVLQGIVGVQKYFRGHQARRHFNELKKGVTTLQSCNILIFLDSFLLNRHFTGFIIFLCMLLCCTVPPQTQKKKKKKSIKLC